MHVWNSISGRTVMTVQYWRSFEQLHAYAHAKDLAHIPAWAEFNRKVGGNGAVGVFHETYVVAAGRYEAVYVNTPRMGLAKAGAMAPATGRMKDAKTRMGWGLRCPFYVVRSTYSGRMAYLNRGCPVLAC